PAAVFLYTNVAMTSHHLRLRLLLPALFGALLLGSGPLHAADAELAPLAAQSLLLDGQAVGKTLIAVGERGHILTSSDAGRSWQQLSVPTRATLTSVFFTDAQHGWAAGHDAVILGTADGGRTWRKMHEDLDSGPILDLWFRDANTGYAIGAYGLGLATHDGGTTWEPMTITDETGVDTDLHLNQLRALADGRLIVAMESGRLLLSADSGRTWRTLPSPYEGSLFGTLPFDSEGLLAFGLRGHLFLSNDAGRNWRPIVAGTEAILNDAIRLRDGRIVVVGLAGTVLISSDSGEHFSLRQQPDRAGFAKALEAADGALILLGAQGARRIELTATGGTP
ncbi:MAG: YCF48-related protein, partial [Desulfuromonadales bacterium]|nr:YCF48-related protein [Desulfuromonadales bacterium]